MLPHKTQSIVVDSGTFSTKAGFSGDETPRLVMRSVVGKIEDDATNRLYFGDDLNVRRDRLALRHPFDDKGLVLDWNLMESIWDQVFQRLSVDSKEASVLLAEPSDNARIIREKHTELLFEKKGIRSLFMGKDCTGRWFDSYRTNFTVRFNDTQILSKLHVDGTRTRDSRVAQFVLSRKVRRSLQQQRTLETFHITGQNDNKCWI